MKKCYILAALACLTAAGALVAHFLGVCNPLVVASAYALLAGAYLHIAIAYAKLRAPPLEQ